MTHTLVLPLLPTETLFQYHKCVFPQMMGKLYSTDAFLEKHAEDYSSKSDDTFPLACTITLEMLLFLSR